MHGVVSLLDLQATHMVDSIWVELEHEFGLSSLYVPRIAHFSYQIAEDYGVKSLGAALEQTAQTWRPFRVRTSGLGMFTGPNPVLYIPVVRSVELSQLHRVIWNAIEGAGTGVSPLYHPEFWMPHITLAQGDLDNHNLPAIVRRLSSRALDCETTINNVGLIYQTGQEHRLKFRFGFQGGTGENTYHNYN